MDSKQDLKATLNLPDQEFTIPMRANLGTREPEIQAKWDAMNIYGQILAAREGAPEFVFHDGPPYTNGPIHMGTALNKILKDFVVKSRSMMGFRCPNVPGFDNHGLPIELAVLTEFRKNKQTPTIPELREACRAHATRYIQTQTEQFKRLGVFALWEEPYRTMDFRYEAEIVRTFGRLLDADQVYRGLRPVMWSPTSRTALADTEIVYKDHTSRSIYVRFPLVDDHNGWAAGLENVFTIIWTTTPWTIPANLAVAFHPTLEYLVIEHEGDHYVVQRDLAEKVWAELGWGTPNAVKDFLGSSFEHSRFKHPIFERDSVGVLADYITTEDGTGVVHTAPGHGREDFVTGAKYGLPVLCPVDERGVLTEEAGEFAGTFYADCDTVVVERLREFGHLLHDAPYEHSYPHGERDGQPVIFRATEQWFISIDDNGLRRRMLDEIDRVEWKPAQGKSRIRAMIENRPDWCFSRQRPWGVGIPVFYGAKSGQPVLDRSVVERVAAMIEAEGSDAWFTKDPSEILPPGYTHPDTGETEFRKENDTFDVWFDSGASSLCVLEGNVNSTWKARWPADLYFEGSDQHRGWFNTSLILGMIARGDAPYETVVTHGFVNDEKGLKMSKRLGNVLEPVEAATEFGADVLRTWAASVKWEDDVSIGPNLLKQSGDTYRKVRNTLRFLLANLSDFDPSAPAPLDTELDRWALEQAELLAKQVVDAYRRYEFGEALEALHSFCSKEMSEFYLDAIKDRMYCDGKDWPSRRSAQWACYRVLNILVRLAAPLLPHTAEEVYERIPEPKLASVHLEKFALPDEDAFDAIAASERQERFAKMLAARAAVFAEFEKFKQTGEVKDSQDAIVSLTDSQEEVEVLRSFGEDLALYFRMSWVELEVGEPSMRFRVSEFLRCERSRLRRPDVQEVNGVALSRRDRQVLGL